MASLYDNPENDALQAAHLARRIPNGADPSHWMEVLNHEDGSVTLCLSPALAKAWSDGLTSALGMRAVRLSPAVAEVIRG